MDTRDTENNQNSLQNLNPVRDLLDRILQPALALDAGSRIVYANSSFLTLSGYRPGSLSGKKYEDLPVIARNGDATEHRPSHDSCSFAEVKFRVPSGTPVMEEQGILLPGISPDLVLLLYRDITSRICAEEAAQEAFKKLQHDYGERVKEQTLFYTTAKLIQDTTGDPAAILQEIVVLIPPGWQYPEVCAARIRYGEISVTSPTFRDTPWIQTAEFFVKGGKRGYVDVVYLEEKPAEPGGEGSFLAEERNLINSLAEMLKTYLDRKSGEEILQMKFKEQEKLVHDYGERVKEQTLFYATAKLIQDDSLPPVGILQKIVVLIPPGWQYPEVCAARIRYGEISVTSPTFRETRWIQTEEFAVKGGRHGFIDIVYLEEKPAEPGGEGPFLAEERNLIISLAEMLKTYLDRKSGEQALEEETREVTRQMESLVAHAANALRSIQDASKGTRNIAKNSGLVSTNARKVSTGIDEILHAIGNMSASVEEITASMEEVSSISRQANERSHEGARVAGNAETSMREIANSTETAGSLVMNIEQQMADISKIVGLIRDIANQTNLLALNAAIEAARAGEAGRGFAVVASEVKSLAEESRKSAEKIEEMINHLKTEAGNAAAAMEKTRSVVDHGSAAVTETVRSFTWIAAEIEKIASSAAEVASATGDQATTTGGITENVNTISLLVHGTSDEAEESASATEELSASIAEISRVVEQVNTIALSMLEANRKLLEL
ncbi:MAG: methyl-accepting chemotaxis protein [Methanoregula sp.]|nr:methyl-accepting chemotaxis protein [Methanoregula sp.]